MAPMTVVSSSELETYRQCRLKHQLQYIERWRTDEEAEALSRGTLFHSVMEAHYRTIQEVQAEGNKVEPIDLLAAVRPHLYTDGGRGGDTQTERQELVEWIYRGYIDCYGIDPLWKVVGVEVPLNTPLAGSADVYLSGTADLLIEDLEIGGVWIVDHKTCKDLPKKDFDLEDQTAIYAYLLKQQGYDIRGAIYNHCRTYRLVGDIRGEKLMTDAERFKRQLTVRTDKELETCAYEALELMEEAYARNLDADNEFGRRDAPRSPNGDTCGWKCNLTEACVTGRKYGPDRTRQYLIDVGFERKDTKPGPTFNKERIGA